MVSVAAGTRRPYQIWMLTGRMGFARGASGKRGLGEKTRRDALFPSEARHFRRDQLRRAVSTLLDSIAFITGPLFFPSARAGFRRSTEGGRRTADKDAYIFPGRCQPNPWGNARFKDFWDTSAGSEIDPPIISRGCLREFIVPRVSAFRYCEYCSSAVQLDFVGRKCALLMVTAM